MGTIHPITFGYCQITPHGFFQIFPSFALFNLGMSHEDYFDKYYHNISLTNTGITLLDFFFFLQSTFHTSDSTVSWVVLVLHMTKQKPREVN